MPINWQITWHTILLPRSNQAGSPHPRRPAQAGDQAPLTIFSQSRQVNFSRTCWITFHCRGMTSSVSVMSSPSLRSRGLPQHTQTVGPRLEHPLAPQILGKGLARRALAGEGRYVGGLATASAATSSWVAELSSSSKVSPAGCLAGYPASLVRLLRPRWSVSSTGHSSHILIRCSTRPQSGAAICPTPPKARKKPGAGVSPGRVGQ